MREKLNNKKGISLIVLIITIMVIVILSAAVLLNMTEDNPIDSAREAVNETNIAKLKEEANVIYSQWYKKKYIKGEEVESATEYVKNNLKGNYDEALIASLIITKGGEILISDSIVEGVFIPNGFTYKEGTIDTGLVIKNSTDGNEFVWVPVEVPAGKTFEDVFVREAGYYDGEMDLNWNKIDYEEPYTNQGAIVESDEINEYESMIASVKKYGGFYIARYESSNNGSGVAQSKPDKVVWQIEWGNSMTEIGTTGAVAKARAVYPDSPTKAEGEAVSTLIYGVQWDATVNWLEKSYSNISQNSEGKGNYADPVTYAGKEINTGSNPNFALNNIYDMAGNIQEWTMEAYVGEPEIGRVGRGGFFMGVGSDIPVSYRYAYVPNSGNLAFRIALYIK